MKMCCINIHLTVNHLTFQQILHCNLLYTVDRYYLNKKLNSKVFPCTNFTDWLMSSRIHSLKLKNRLGSLV